LFREEGHFCIQWSQEGEKVNGQYDINYYIKRKQKKKRFQEQQNSSMHILSFNRRRKKKYIEGSRLSYLIHSMNLNNVNECT
jgi:hypothetical protein